MGTIPVILSGFGWWVKNRTVIPLLTQYPKLIKVVAVTSVSEEEFDQKVKPTFQDNGWVVPRLVSDFNDACSEMRSQVDKTAAVLVTTPNSLHFSEAKNAIKMGYHVYVERPIVTKNEDLPALVELADQHQVFLFTGTQRRLEDPFQYLRKIVTEHYKFGDLKRIRCRFSARHCLKDWRRVPELSGGGVIVDSGYHLLDIAAWLVEATGTKINESLNGAIHLNFEESPDCGENGAGIVPVETEASGFIELPNGILITLDFSYNAPVNSIYEQIELYDQNFTRVSLTRDQNVRTALPATVTHQLPDGQFIDFETPIGLGIRAEAIRFAGKAQNTEPLRLFITSVQKGYNNISHKNTLEARNSISVWYLVREIYRLAANNSISERNC